MTGVFLVRTKLVIVNDATKTCLHKKEIFFCDTPAYSRKRAKAKRLEYLTRYMNFLNQQIGNFYF